MLRTSARSPYEVLGVRDDADIEVIQAAFRALARRYHPDKAGPGGEIKMKEINAAWEILSDPSRRASYDAERRLANARASSPVPGTGPPTSSATTSPKEQPSAPPGQQNTNSSAREWFETHTGTAVESNRRGQSVPYRAESAQGSQNISKRDKHAWTLSGSITVRTLSVAVRAIRWVISSVASSDASQGQGIATGATLIFFLVIGLAILPGVGMVATARNVLADAFWGFLAILAILIMLDVARFWILKQIKRS